MCIWNPTRTHPVSKDNVCHTSVHFYTHINIRFLLSCAGFLTEQSIGGSTYKCGKEPASTRNRHTRGKGVCIILGIRIQADWANTSVQIHGILLECFLVLTFQSPPAFVT